MQNTQSKRITELDSLRGLAALIVMLFHYGWRFGEMFPGATHLTLPVQWGAYGVHLFFAISGFVIFMTLDRTKTVADFVVSRFSRLYPVYWACIAITMAVLAMLPVTELNQPLWVAMIDLSMVQSLFKVASVDGVYWSLFVELCFYACMTGLWRIGLLRRPEWVLIGWIGLKILWAAVPALPYTIGALLIVKYIPFFAIGMTAYRVWIGQRRISEQGLVLLAGLAATWWVDGSEFAVVYIAVAAITCLLAIGKLRWASHPILLWLGAISYPLYLLHQNIGYAVMIHIAPFGVPPLAAVVLAILLSFALAYVVHRFVERPSLKLIRNWWKSVSAKKLVTHPA